MYDTYMTYHMRPIILPMVDPYMTNMTRGSKMQIFANTKMAAAILEFAKICIFDPWGYDILSALPDDG